MDSWAINVSLELWFAAFCLVAAACLLAGQEERKLQLGRISLALIQLSNAFYMMFEAMAWLFDGKEGNIAFWAVSIFNFLSFSSEYLMIGVMAYYIRSRVLENGQIRVKYFWGISFALFDIAAIVLLIINNYTGWFYYIDFDNVYQRGEYYIFSQAIGFVMIILLFIVLIVERRSLSKITRLATVLYIVLPLMAMVYQLYHYGFSFVGVATTVSALLLFIAYEMDRAKKIEKENREHIKKLTYKF